jgi:putative sterol carrier protein
MPQRFKSVKEVIDFLPGQFNPEQMGDLNATAQFDLSGEEGGQWNASVANGKLTIHEGVAANPNLTFSGSANDFLAMANGDLNPMSAFMQGRIKVRGDLSLAMRMQKMFAR